MNKDYVYTGQENLESMQEAINYNRYQYNFIADQINRQKKTGQIKILDFGAGIGTYADMLKQSNWQVSCVEPDPKQAVVLKKKGYQVYKDIADVKDKYDVIYALNVFEHIEDDAKSLAAIQPRLSGSGVVIIYVPAFKVLWTNLDDLVEHYRRYRLDDAKKLARLSGLQLKSVKYCDPIGFWAALAYRLVGGSGQLNPRSIKIFDRILFPVSVFLEPITQKLFGKNVLAIYAKQ